MKTQILTSESYENWYIKVLEHAGHESKLYFHVSVPSVSKPIAVVEGLRYQRLRLDAAKLRTSVSGQTDFRLAFLSSLSLYSFLPKV